MNTYVDMKAFYNKAENMLNKMLINNNNSQTIKCPICGSSISFNNFNKKTEIIEYLIDNNWHIVNDDFYCEKCFKQFLMLSSVDHVRPSKIQYYLNIAKEVASRSTCLRKKYGCVIVKNDIIISTGYNGSPRGTKNCIDLNYCRREQMHIPQGQCYELCRSVHAEMNAIINAEREKMIDSTLYLYGCDISGNIIDNIDSCQMCKKLIINAGIKQVVFALSNSEYKCVEVIDWIKNDETLTNKMGY